MSGNEFSTVHGSSHGTSYGSSALMILASFMAALSVVTLATIYAAAILRATRERESVLTKILAPYGRMALTNYISQSLLAIAVGHWNGFGAPALAWSCLLCGSSQRRANTQPAPTAPNSCGASA